MGWLVYLHTCLQADLLHTNPAEAHRYRGPHGPCFELTQIKDILRETRMLLAHLLALASIQVGSKISAHTCNTADQLTDGLKMRCTRR